MSLVTTYHKKGQTAKKPKNSSVLGCSANGCSRKIFMNGYCSKHVSMGRSIPPKPVHISQEEQDMINKRREKRIEDYLAPRRFREAEILFLKKRLPYSSVGSAEQHELDALILEHQKIEEEETVRLNDDIENLKRYYYEKYWNESGNMANGFAKPRKRSTKFESDDSHDDTQGTHHGTSGRHSRKRDEDNDSDDFPSEEHGIPLASDGINVFNRAERNAFIDLSIEITLDITEIKKAYRRGALNYHPDRNPTVDTAADFRKINEAYLLITRRLEKIEA
jgi:hypothetical protein